MAVISVTITESTEQVVSGIPRSIAISTNIPSTIFYTIDGTDPTLFSSIYIDPIVTPTDRFVFVLKVWATNGIDYSPIITETYQTTIADNTRLSHSATNAEAGSNIPALYPFGTNPIEPTTEFLNPGDAGITVDDPSKAQIPTGFDGSGNPTGFTNEEFNTENYSIKYSTTDSEGRTGRGIGNLPGHVTIEYPSAPPETTTAYTQMFDPRAKVIYQDVTNENLDDPPLINRGFFSLENPERARDGNLYFNSGLDAPPVSGSFLRSHYNPRDNTITYYYLDTTINKWIISKTPYQPNGSFDGNLSGILASRGKGSKYVFTWQPFARRVLF